MDKLTYQEIIKRILREHAQYRSKADNQVTSQVVYDDEHGHYLLLDVGWYDKKYWHTNPIHIDIIKQKIWIQYDETEEGIATDLLEAGIPEEQIVLGFKHPRMRPHTAFAAS